MPFSPNERPPYEIKWTFSWQIIIDWTNEKNFKFKSVKLSKKKYENLSLKELWTELTTKELNFINHLLPKFGLVSSLSHSQTWIVTWANDFFIVSESIKQKYKLDKYCIPIIRKWYYTKNNLEFTIRNFDCLRNEGKSCFLLKINGNTADKNLIKYLKIWEKQEIHKRYKCSTYVPNWYNTPNIWGSELIFFKRSHIAPKLIYNPLKIDVTDSWYRIILNDKDCAQEFQYCFYNSFTILMMELWWRTYGWWVLEITPNEFKKLPIPFFKNIARNELSRFNKDNLDNIEHILQKNDNYLLRERLWLSEQELEQVKLIRLKLMNKRLKLEQ